MYKSPMILVEKLSNWTTEQFEDKIVNTVCAETGIIIYKEELAKLLKNDRDQYDKGFADGRAARDKEIVRCKECRWGRYDELLNVYWCDETAHTDDFYCANGREKGEQNGKA